MAEKRIKLLDDTLDGTYVQFLNIPELTVPQGYVPWWYENDRRPEYRKCLKSDYPKRVILGDASLHFFTMYAAVTCGVYIPIRLTTPVGVVRFTGSVQVFSRNDDTDFERSTGRLYVRLGINPYGDVSPLSDRTVWGKVFAPYDRFLTKRIEADVRSDVITLWVWTQSEWPFKHNNVWVDNLQAEHFIDTQEDDTDNESVLELRSAMFEIANSLSSLSRRITEILGGDM